MKILLFLIVTVFFHSVVSAQEMRRAPVEVYIDGQKYASLSEYRLAKMRTKLSLAFSPEELERNPMLLDELMAELSQKNMDEITNAQIAELVESYKKKPVDAIAPVNTSADDLFALQEMLEDLKAHNPEAKSVEIDPAQMKTIIIAPAGPKKQEAGNLNHKDNPAVLNDNSSL